MRKLKAGILAALMVTTVLASGMISFADSGFRSGRGHMGQNASYNNAQHMNQNGNYKNYDYMNQNENYTNYHHEDQVQALSKLTGLSEKEIYDKTKDSNLGEIAYNAGVWEEWSNQMLETKKEMFDDRVQKGYMTQAQADEIYNDMLEHHNEMKENPDFDQMYKNNQGLSGKGFNMGNQRGQGLGQGCHGGLNNQ